MFTLSLDTLFLRTAVKDLPKKPILTCVPSKNVDESFVEVFLVGKGLGKKERKGDFSHCFDSALFLEREPLFFSQQQAIDFIPFLDETQGMFRVFIPERAILGRFNEFNVNMSLISPHLIAGCFPSWGKGREYHQNPHYKPVKKVHTVSPAEGD